jgi:hypothetical protein
MTATAGLSLTLDPMGKMFQNASSLKPLGQLKPNCPGMIIGRSSVFYADRKSKMATTAGHRLTLDPMGFMYSLALIIFVVSEKKAFEHFPKGSNVNLCIAVAAILDFPSTLKKMHLQRTFQ